MRACLLLAIDGVTFAEGAGAWLPDLVAVGFRRVTLFHAVGDDGPAVARELDALRPLLDRLAVTLSAQGVETDVALKRGDPVKWLAALADVRHSDLIVVGMPDDSPDARTGFLDALLAEAHAPVLVLPARRPADSAAMFAHAVLLRGDNDSRVLAAVRDLMPAPLPAPRLESSVSTPLAASLWIAALTADRTALDGLLRQARCPLLLYPAQALRRPAPTV